MQSFAGGLCLNDAGFTLLRDLLHMDPSQRISADEALRHSWFQEDPLPTSPGRMPTFSD
jgi:serine/threonine protein kinase